MKSVIFTPRTLAPARMRFSCGVLARRLMRRLRVCWVVAISNTPVMIVLTMYTSEAGCQLVSWARHRWPDGQRREGSKSSPRVTENDRDHGDDGEKAGDGFHADECA